ncbi:MAG: hypothetical protein LH629_11065 [Ignavibacteria bacterium]|nr:hypothetical protein [Ignavibacteria bacterium]
MSYPLDLIPDSRTKISNCNFQNISVESRSCFQQKARFQNVNFENMQSDDLLRISGVIFDKVVLKGKFDRLLLKSDHAGMMFNHHERGIDFITGEECAILNAYAENEYQKIEWALDIIEAEFRECDLHPSIPANLVKINPETQVLIKYDKIAKINWKEMSTIQSNDAKYWCSLTEKNKRDSIFIAPQRNKKRFGEYMESFKILREEGIVSS